MTTRETPARQAGRGRAVPHRRTPKASRLAILSKTGITDVYASSIVGDVGTSPITGAIKTFPRRGIKDSPPLRRVAPQKSALDVELERRIIPRAPDVDGEYRAGAIACEQRVDGFEEKPFHAGHRL